MAWGIWAEARGKARRNLQALSWALEPRQSSPMTRLCVDEQPEAQRNERVQPVGEPKVGLSDKAVCTVIKTLPEVNLHTLGKDKFHHPKTGVLILATPYHCNATMSAITGPETVTGSPDTWELTPLGLSREQMQFHRMLEIRLQWEPDKNEYCPSHELDCCCTSLSFSPTPSLPPSSWVRLTITDRSSGTRL